MFHFENWPDNGFPRDEELLQLVNKVEDSKQQQGDKQQPVVVMCRYSKRILIVLISQTDSGIDEKFYR